MSPEESGLDAAAARMAWQLQSGWSSTRVYLWWRSEYPLTDPGFLDRSLAQAEEMRATAVRLQNLAPDDPILEAYERPLALDQPVGVRYVVPFDTQGGETVWRSFGVDVRPETTRREVEQLILEQVAEHLQTRPSAIDMGSALSTAATMQPISSLFGPLPQRLP